MVAWNPSENYTTWLTIPSGICVIMAIIGLGDQRKSVRASVLGIIGILFAILANVLPSTYFNNTTSLIVFFVVAFACSLPGIIFGLIQGRKCPVDDLPKMVGLYNAFGGIASSLFSLVYFLVTHDAMFYTQFELLGYNAPEIVTMRVIDSLSATISNAVGSATFFGSLIAVGKLTTRKNGRSYISTKQRFGPIGVLVGLAAATIVLVVVLVVLSVMDTTYKSLNNYIHFGIGVALIICSGLLSALVSLRVGGADMSILISMLNSISGWSVAATGITNNDPSLIIVGAIVGTSGIILSLLMCEAMNVSVMHVLGLDHDSRTAHLKKGDLAPKSGADDAETDTTAPGVIHHRPMMKEVMSIPPSELAKKILDARSVMIVPGFGLSVCKGQFVLKEIVDTLLKPPAPSVPKNVVFAIHPVAGRLPGHMNMILAEAGVPYKIVQNLSESNAMLDGKGGGGVSDGIDLCIAIGTCDVCNPGIVGMPAIEVWKASEVVFVKRSTSPGYSGVPNPVFMYDNTSMCMGDSKKQLETVKGIIDEEMQKLGAGRSTDDVSSVLTESEDEELKEDAYAWTRDARKPYPLPTATLGVPVEHAPRERRVAITPLQVPFLRAAGIQVKIETGAGTAAGYPDGLYRKAGAIVVDTYAKAMEADFIGRVTCPTPEEIAAIPPYPGRGKEIIGHTNPTIPSPPESCVIEETPRRILMGLVNPAGNEEAMRLLAENNVDVISFERVPRSSQAQHLDALSTMGGLGGYMSVIRGASLYQRYIGPRVTASGDTSPAKVLVIGCGVAGLAAISTAHDLKADVFAFDTRMEAADQVVSCGGKFLRVKGFETVDGSGAGGYAKTMSKEFIDAEMDLFLQYCRICDMVITTAAIPNRPAPKLLEERHIMAMKPGSVIVDLAALTGGNCVGTVRDEVIIHEPSGVIICGETDFTSRMANVASQLYGQNIANMAVHIGRGIALPEGQPPTQFEQKMTYAEYDDHVVAGHALGEGRIRLSEFEMRESVSDEQIAKMEAEQCALSEVSGDVRQQHMMVPPAPLKITVSGQEPRAVGSDGNLRMSSFPTVPTVVEKLNFVHPCFSLTPEDTVMGPSVCVFRGATVPMPPPKPVSVQPESAATAVPVVSAQSIKEDEAAKVKSHRSDVMHTWVIPIVGLIVLAGIGASVPSRTSNLIFMFILGCFIGWRIIQNVSPTLHTPLMSLTNAISGVVLLGGVSMMCQYFLGANSPPINALKLKSPEIIISGVLIVIASNLGWINVVGGFTITQRCISMVSSSAK